MKKGLADAEAAVAASKARISELEAQVALMTAKRTGLDTTVDDVYEAFPQVKKEIEEEIANHEWHKDIQ